jgi:predicted nuclease of restriction endonuclease-like (RecB) superfamily
LTNFPHALEPVDAGSALQATKDPYIVDFLELAEDVREGHLEQALIDDIQKPLLELGTGFVFYGRQNPPYLSAAASSSWTCCCSTTRCGAS